MFVKICWGITALATVLGLFQLISTMDANGAPQQAAGAAMAVAIAVIPYVFTRCVEGIASPRKTG